ncbi:MAG TPA: cytochrome D1 domain-containing protein [Candidatus Limnocylindria bacterium]|nr:cytochrome D1 domain-containing protein [Candidatus Limnocylindria bacterium]
MIRAGRLLRVAGAILTLVLLTRCASASLAGPIAAAPSPSHPPAAVAPASPAPAAARTVNVYAATTSGFAPAVADLAPRVYVPNEHAGTVSVIDPATFTVIRTVPIGEYPEHVTPSWDLTRLYVNDGGITELDPRTGAVIRRIAVPDPYNLYFTLDGTKAIVVAEMLKRLDFYDSKTWTLLKSVPIPWAGVDHLDMSADGSYLLASAEYTGRVVKVDTTAMAVVGSVDVGGLPIDVKLAPDGTVFYVTNQGRGGVSIVDPLAMREIGFIPTGRGAHGLAISRDTRSLYVSNRLAGTISVIDLATRQVAATWTVGGSPDMLSVSADGTQLWTGNRFAASVIVVDTATGQVIKTIPVGRSPHGLTFFPQPGRLSLGHNGVYR